MKLTASSAGAGEVEVCSARISEYSWTQMKPDETQRAAAGTALSMPSVYEPQGSRFATSGGNIEWMGWELHVSADDWHGLTAHAVRFRGETVAYEISTMEVFASYSGVGSTHQVFYHDSQWRALWRWPSPPCHLKAAHVATSESRE